MDTNPAWPGCLWERRGRKVTLGIRGRGAEGQRGVKERKRRRHEREEH